MWASSIWLLQWIKHNLYEWKLHIWPTQSTKAQPVWQRNHNIWSKVQVSPDRSYGVCVCCVLAAAQKLMVIKIIRRNRKSHAAIYIYIYILHSRRARAQHIITANMYYNVGVRSAYALCIDAAVDCCSVWFHLIFIIIIISAKGGGEGEIIAEKWFAHKKCNIPAVSRWWHIVCGKRMLMLKMVL